MTASAGDTVTVTGRRPCRRPIIQTPADGLYTRQVIPARRPSLRLVVPVALAALLVVASLAVAPAATTAQSSEQPAAVGVVNVTASTQSPATGEPFSLGVTVANYEGSGQAVTLNQLVVAVGGERRHIVDDLGRLTPGSRTTVRIPLTLENPGQRTVSLTVYGSSDRGLVNTRSQYVVEVRDPQQPSLSVSVPDTVAGASREVNVTVANGGEGPIENVVLRAGSSADAVSFDETTRVRGRIAAGETLTFTLPARTTAAGSYPVDLSLAYVRSGASRTVEETFVTRFAEPANPGRVILSGVETSRRGGTFELSATASNVGGQEVGGVVVTVNGTDAVRPQTYFVGSIEESGFSSFSLRTGLTGDPSVVPVAVTYVSGGVERSFTTEVSVPAASRPATPSGGGGSVLGTAVPIAAGAVVALVGGVIYRRRR